MHPTCGRINIRLMAKLVALTDMMLGLLGTIWFVYMMTRYNIISLEAFEEPYDSAKLESLDLDQHEVHEQSTAKVITINQKALSMSLMVLFTSVNFIVFVILLIGVYKKHIGLCLTWFYVRCAIFIFKLIIFIIYLIGGRPMFSQIPFIVSMGIHLYGLWVVNTFINHLRESRLAFANAVLENIDEIGDNGNNGENQSPTYEHHRRIRHSQGIINGIEILQKHRKEFYDTKK